jgi:nucleoside-diphosphate-sugar epimerase
MQAYNVCSGEGVSIGEILDTLIDLSGGGLEVEESPALARSVDVTAQIGDCSRLCSLGWESSIRLRDGLEALLSWWEDKG